MPPKLLDSKRIVIKIGSALIAEQPHGHLRSQWLSRCINDIASLYLAGKEVIIVCSGSVALGRQPLRLGSGALKLEEQQAAGACGQIILINAWKEKLNVHGINCAQLLMTIGDTEDRRRYLNARSTIEKLIEHGTVPVINENDTVATSELRYGDNDRLAARVAAMAGADALVLLSDIDGLYTKDPNVNPDAEFVPVVENITSDIEEMAGDPIHHISSGGMKTKLAAAHIARNAGCHTIISAGNRDEPLSHIANGGQCTWFMAQDHPLSARKHWIAGALDLSGNIYVDDGARAALSKGKSLLPSGVERIDGDFERGDIVWLRDSEGTILGKGLIAYTQEETQQLIGHHSEDIEDILGYSRGSVLVHSDDMVIETKDLLLHHD